MKTYLGKIGYAKFGIGGYQDAQFGLTVRLEFDGSSCVTDFKGFWGVDTSTADYTNWNEDHRGKAFADVCRFVNQLIIDAKKTHVTELIGTPVEVTLDGNKLHAWRVLKEVL